MKEQTVSACDNLQAKQNQLDLPRLGLQLLYLDMLWQ